MSDLRMNAFGLPTCPDCTAVPTGQTMRHDETCPMGRDSDAQLADDAAWFEAHPEASERHRPVWLSEVWTLRAALPPLPEGTEFAGEVIVRQVAPGVRFKDFNGVYALVGGDPR